MRGLQAVAHLQRGGSLERSCPVCVYVMRALPELACQIDGIADTSIAPGEMLRQCVEFEWRAG